MRARLLLMWFVGVLLGLALSYGAAHAGTRPNELVLFLRLNGEPTRPTQTDGGPLMLYSVDGGVASIDVSAGGVYKVSGCFSNSTGTAVDTNICVVNPYAGTWDGGCNNSNIDVNYGDLLAGGSSRWIVLGENTATLAAKPTSGAAVYCPLFLMQ